jgi:outer membrane protein insertion porin family
VAFPASTRVLARIGTRLATAGFALLCASHASAQAQGPVDLAAPPAQAEAAPAPETRSAPTVAVVQVTGNRRIEADAIKAVIGTKVGTTVSSPRLADDVRRIYALGFFHDVRVDVSPTEGGAVVTFLVEENPVIRQVSITGNEEIGADDIKEKLTVTVGSTVDYPLLLENAARIEAQYQAKGFYLAKVNYVLEPMGDGSVGVNFDVVEGEKLRLKKIDFQGNQAFSSSDLEEIMTTKTWGITSYVSQLWDNSGLYAEPIFYEDLDKIQRKYMDEGYIRVNVGQPRVEVVEDGLTVHVAIDEGPQFHVGTVDILGDETMNRDELLALVRLQPGAIFSRSVLTGDVDRLRNYYADRGFFDAAVNPITNVDPEKLLIATNFEVKKGELYFVDGIDVNGNTRTADTVVRRELSIGEAELYSASAVAKSKMRVQRLGYFEEVEIQARPTDQPNRVAMAVDVVERPTGSFSFGAGVGSVDGFVVSGSIRQDNLFGTGRSLSAGADLGSVNRTYYIRFVEPYVFNTSGSLTATLQSARSEYIDFEEEQSGAGISYAYPLDEGETWASSGYSWAARSIDGIDFQAASLLEREELQGDTTTSLASLSLRRDTRDDFRFPKYGHVSGFAMEFAGLGGFSEFLRLEARTTRFYPMKDFLPFESTFVFNSRAGYVFPFNTIDDFDLPGCTDELVNQGGQFVSCQALTDIDPDEIRGLERIDERLELPLTERYFLGGLGAFQVRGFKQRSLGPRRTRLDQTILSNGDRAFSPVGFNADGSCDFGPGNCNSLDDEHIDDFENLDVADVIGGNSMALVNLELQFPISEDMGLSGLFFFDAGNAFDETEFINPLEFRLGTGAGIQWFSPFGPILVVLGFPLDPLEDEDGSVFEFSLGGQQY